MTLDPIAAQIILAIMVNAPIWYLMRANFRKTNTDAYDSLSNALQTSGKTIDDLFRMLAEVPKLQQQVAELREELERRDEIIESQNVGIGILLSQIGDARMTPRWRPLTAQDTRPIKNKKSGFGKP
jgi:transposase